MLYLPRLFVYHSGAAVGSEQSETFKIMERRLLKAIINPAMIVTWIAGLWLAWNGHYFSAGWMSAKFTLVILMSAVHGYLAKTVRVFAEDKNEKSAGFYRVLNERQLISSGSPFEQVAGYSRAVVQGDWAFVAGTTGYDYKSMILPDEAGFALDNVVRVRYIVTDRAYAPALFEVSGHYFHSIRPAATLIIAGLLEEKMKVEIEVTALRSRGA
eukprot:gene10067-10137_t